MYVKPTEKHAKINNEINTLLIFDLFLYSQNSSTIFEYSEFNSSKFSFEYQFLFRVL